MHELISAGWWPGSGKIAGPAFCAYAAPEPKGFAEAKIVPQAAHYDRDLGKFVLMYDDMRKADSPRAALLDFLQSLQHLSHRKDHSRKTAPFGGSS